MGSISSSASEGPQRLPASQIPAFQKQPCTFVHAWATWCSICVTELPNVFKSLASLKKVNPVVIDLSSPFVQENFSKKYVAKLAPPFKTYLKPPGSEAVYMSVLEPKWTKELPYSALFHRGKRVKVWVGALDLPKLEKEIELACK